MDTDLVNGEDALGAEEAEHVFDFGDLVRVKREGQPIFVGNVLRLPTRDTFGVVNNSNGNVWIQDLSELELVQAASGKQSWPNE